MSTTALTPVETAPPESLTTDLRDARRDLDGLADRAAADSSSRPSALAFTNARRLLSELYRLRPCRVGVSSTAEGEIALEVRGRAGQSVLVRCGSDGRVRCSLERNGSHRWARYGDAADLPDAFVREALDDPSERPNAPPAEPEPSAGSEDDELREARRELDEVPEEADEE